MNLRPITIIMGLSICLASCGTMSSRGGDHAFGGYPFKAVATDGVMISRYLEPKVQLGSMTLPGWNFTLWGILSLPFDLVLDTLALPIDLGAWAFGANKSDGFAAAGFVVPPVADSWQYEQVLDDFRDWIMKVDFESEEALQAAKVRVDKERKLWKNTRIEADVTNQLSRIDDRLREITSTRSQGR